MDNDTYKKLVTHISECLQKNDPYAVPFHILKDEYGVDAIFTADIRTRLKKENPKIESRPGFHTPGAESPHEFVFSYRIL